MIKKIKILFLSDWYPYPVNNGSKLRIDNLLKGLSHHYEIILACFSDNEKVDPIPEQLLSILQEVHIVPIKPYNPKSIKSLFGYLRLTPRSFIDTYSAEMAACIQKVVDRSRPDAVIASQFGTAIYFKGFAGIPAILDEVEVGLIYERHIKATSPVSRFRNWLTWWKHSRYLSKVLQHFSSCTVVSEKEKELLQKIAPKKLRIDVIPNCVNIADYQGISEIPQPETIIFTGSFKYHPNFEAMAWFIKDVFPLIQAKIPKAKLIITGDHANLPLPHNESIKLTGFVKDVRPLIARSGVSVVPLISGGGTRLKVLEAMALRIPVVSTSKGAEGLDVSHGENILISDGPSEFAGHVIRLMTDPELRHTLVNNAEMLVRIKYDWTVVMPKFLELTERVTN